MIRTLLTSTAIAAVLATGAMAQQNTSTPPANTAAPATPPSTDTNTPANNMAAPANTTAPADTAAPANTTTTAPADTTTTTAPANNMAAPANTTTTETTSTTTTTPANTTTTPANTTTTSTTNTDATAAANATTETGRTPIVLEQGFSRLTGDDLASNIIGADVYNSAGDDADDIGEINDLVVGQDGDIAAAVIGVGGFLGIGEKNVAVDFDSLELTQATDGSFRYILNTTEDALKAAPDFQWDDTNPADVQGVDADRDGVADNQTNTGDNAAAAVDNAATNVGNAANNAANGVAAGAAATADAAGNMAAGAANTTADAVNNATGTPAVGTIDPNSMQQVAPEAMTADNLDGTAVYGANNEQVGSISDFVLNAQGQIDAVVVDVGGFLGIGAKPVALGFDNLNFRQDQNGNRYLFINATKEQLEAQPQFDADTYEQNRDTMRMTATAQ